MFYKFNLTSNKPSERSRLIIGKHNTQIIIMNELSAGADMIDIFVLLVLVLDIYIVHMHCTFEC